jgi:YHS domain-containing protein
MKNIARKNLLLLSALVLFWPLAASAEVDPINSTIFGGLAVDGYDPVAYFTDGKPVEGKKEHSFEWNGATWRFSSAANRDLFAAAPEKYAPQYGGYCAWAVSQGYTADADPEAWKIVDGKLYLNYDKKVQAQWEKDVPGLIQKADANWPKLRSGG